MMNFLHHLFNPHCEECRICKSCETLREQLARANYEKEQLMNMLFNQNRPIEEPVRPTVTEPIRVGKHIPWAVKQQQLERAERKKAQEIAERVKLEDLEEEVLNPDATRQTV